MGHMENTAHHAAHTGATTGKRQEHRHTAHFITAPVQPTPCRGGMPSGVDRALWQNARLSIALPGSNDRFRAAKIVSRIAAELSVKPQQVAAAVQLLDEGATVPFIARYRKEATDNLDDTQLRNLEERLLYLRELEDAARPSWLPSRNRAN